MIEEETLAVKSDGTFSLLLVHDFILLITLTEPFFYLTSIIVGVLTRVFLILIFWGIYMVYR